MESVGLNMAGTTELNLERRHSGRLEPGSDSSAPVRFNGAPAAGVMPITVMAVGGKRVEEGTD